MQIIFKNSNRAEKVQSILQESSKEQKENQEEIPAKAFRNFKDILKGFKNLNKNKKFAKYCKGPQCRTPQNTSRMSFCTFLCQNFIFLFTKVNFSKLKCKFKYKLKISIEISNIFEYFFTTKLYKHFIAPT